MEYKIVNSVKTIEKFDCLLIPVINKKLANSARKIDRQLAIDLEAVLEDRSTQKSPLSAELITKQSSGLKLSVILIYLDDQENVGLNKLKQGSSEAIALLKSLQSKSIVLSIADFRSCFLSISSGYLYFAKLFKLASYKYERTKSISESSIGVEKVTFFESRQRHIKQAVNTLSRGKLIADGMNFSRKLSDLPANLCTPNYLANQARLLDEKINIKATIIVEEEMQKLGMYLVLAVAKGSQQPAKFIILEYQGGHSNQAPIVLIGKGVTFDSGGYSIKSAPAMDEMKFDMCGAATVFGTISTISKMKLPVNVICVIPCSENLVNGKAFKPGDVLTSMSGQTVEVLSTDAEGRLLIADALTFVDRYQPSIVIDVATLTGACITALGNEISGMMSNNQQLAKRLFKAGQISHDYVWQLPLWDNYGKILNSNFADMASSAGRDDNSGAGAIVAGSFLSKFSSGYRWAHLDVAGPAWHRGKLKGATGRPVSLLCQFIMDYCQKPF